METLSYVYEGKRKITKRAHIGVVASGDLEILVEPTEETKAIVTIKTGSEGFKEVWEAVLERFFIKNEVTGIFTINDFGATPGVVGLRLAQVLEVSEHE